MTLVSVVIPTYNRPKYLRGAIDTALGQTYDDIEVVIVDDGSDEPYVEDIARTYSEDVRIIRHDVNMGLSAARNTGITESNGDYIAFLDDDDRWHKNKIKNQIEVMSEGPSVGIVTCLRVAITPNNRIVHCGSSVPTGDCSDSLLTGNQIGTPSRVLVRKKAIDDIGKFDESLPTKQDWDFYLRLCQNWKVGAVDKYMCFRTVHENMSDSPSAAEDALSILYKHEDLIRERNLWTQAKAEIFERVGRVYLQAGKLQSARKFLKASFRIEKSKRRGAMMLLSYTHPLMVETTTKIKRVFSRQFSDCLDIEINADQIPGLDA